MTYEFENRSRSVYRFPQYRARGDTKRKNAPTMVLVAGKTVVLGDAADAAIPDAQRTVHTPSPRVVLTDEQLEALGPKNRRVLDALVEQGVVTKRPIAA